MNSRFLFVKKFKITAAIKKLEYALKTNWWTILFIICSYYCYEQGLKNRNKDFTKLQIQYHSLQNEKKIISTLHEKLVMQVNSQSDPEWLELVLMKGLGLAPEGQIKVLFTITSNP
jgi:hypothetical protein